MEFLASEKLCYTDGLSRRIAKHREPLEDTVISSLRTGEFKTILCKTLRESPVSLDQIKQEALNDKFIRQTNTTIYEKDRLQIFSPYTTKYCYIVSESSFSQHYKEET